MSSSLGANALNGIAALEQYDIWAVGDKGTVLHYVYDHDPVPPPSTGTPPPPPPPTSTGGGGPPPSKTSPAPLPPPHVTVVQPPPKRTRAHRGHRKATRLVSHVHVKVDIGRLIVTFHLSAPARIQIEGRTKGRVIASAGPRVMRKGRARMILTYRGARPPAQLRIIARPAKKAKP